MASPRTASPLTRTLTLLRPALVALFAISLCLNLLMLVSPLYMLQVFDRVVSSSRTETLIFLTLIAFLALVVLGILELARRRILTRLGTWLEFRLGSTIVSAGLDASLDGTGDGQRALRDLGRLRAFVTGPTLVSLCDAPWVPLFLIFLWWIHPALGLFGLVNGVLLLALAFLNEMATRRSLDEALGLLAGLQRNTNVALRNADSVHSLGMRTAFLGRWQTEQGAVLRRQEKAADRSDLIVSLSKTLRLFAQIGVLGLGAYYVMKSQVTPGGMIASSILLARALAPVDQAIGTWRQWTDARASFESLSQLLRDADRTRPDVELPEPRGELEVEALTVLPRGADQPILRNVSLKLPAGVSLGIIGASGSGKSTLARALVGALDPTRGVVRIDGADVLGWGETELGPHVGWLPQRVEFFEGTVAENIARLQSPDSQSVVRAARLAAVHDLILTFPDGYESRLGHGGVRLSAGQIQRLGLARAVFGAPRLLVLDEPSSNLDAAGEEALQAAIAELKQEGSTVVLIAHRPSALVHMDRLLVLHEGVVRQYGATTDVMSSLHGPRQIHPASDTSRVRSTDAESAGGHA